MKKEIERKFLMNGFPKNLFENGYLCELKTLEQGYLFCDEEKELRIREQLFSLPESSPNNRYKMTIKSSGDLTRDEAESVISQEFYEQIKEMIGKPFIEKEYKAYILKDKRDLLLQVSLVDDSFYYGEIEFDTEEEANDFDMSKYPFLIKDITYDRSYKMKNYWKETRLFDSNRKTVSIPPVLTHEEDKGIIPPGLAKLIYGNNKKDFVNPDFAKLIYSDDKIDVYASKEEKTEKTKTTRHDVYLG